MQNQRVDKIAGKIIEISFYSLFFFTPLLMNYANSELFELPKMFFVWAGTTVIVGAWIIRMIASGRIIFQRTLLDLPLLLFLLSQILSYLFSIDRHTSFWGYYTRFNGGLASTISYTLLYWAFVSNMDFKKSLLAIHLSLITGLFVALWGIPAHFGYDPTCFVFGYGLNTLCWTAQFVPTVRIFSTLGQPNWLAAWLVALMPLAWVMTIGKWKMENGKIHSIFYFLLSTILFFSLIYTNSKSGLAGLIVIIFVFIKKYIQRSWYIVFALLIITGVIGGLFLTRTISITQPITNCLTIIFSSETQNLKSNITPSGDIRCIVWKGALQIWKHYPVFGTGPETFADSYYQFRPVEHNLTSEWDYLYNKAHNEYLNMAANTGSVGLLAYLVLIVSSLFLFAKQISKSEFLISNQIPKPKTQLGQISKAWLFGLEIRSIRNLLIALLAGFASIFVTNFFGFSVVPIQLQFFLYPAMAVTLVTSDKLKITSLKNKLSLFNITVIVIVLLVTCYFLLRLAQYYLADIHYAKAERAANQDDYTTSLSSIEQAVKLRPEEPRYQNELANTLSSIVTLLPEDQVETRNELAKLAKEASDRVASSSPREINFLRNRSTTFLRLASLDPNNITEATGALETATQLAPTEPKIAYNLGFLYLQLKENDKAITYLSRATELRPVFRDAWFALGLAYWETRDKPKAREAFEHILKNINSRDKEVLDKLKEW